MASFLRKLFGSSQLNKHEDHMSTEINMFDLVPENQNDRQEEETPIKDMKKKKKKKKKQRSRDKQATTANEEVENPEEEAEDMGMTEKSTNGRNDIEHIIDEEADMNMGVEIERVKPKKNGGNVRSLKEDKAVIEGDETVANRERGDSALHGMHVKKSRKSGKVHTAKAILPEEVEGADQRLSKPTKDNKTKVKKPNRVLISEEHEVSAPVQYLPVLHESSSQEDLAEVSNQLVAASSLLPQQRERDENATPERPSKKSIGKRKASETFSEPVKKIQRRRKSNESQGGSLLNMGFFSMNRGSREISVTEGFIQKESYTQSTKGQQPASPILPEVKSKSSKLKAKTPIVAQGSGPEIFHISPTPTAAKPAQHSTKQLLVEINPYMEDVDQPLKSPPKSNKKRKRPSDTIEPSMENPGTPLGEGKGAKKGVKAPRSVATPVKSSRLTAGKVEELMDAVEAFRESHDYTQYEVNALIQNKDGSQHSKELWKHVFEAVPNIAPRRVYETCRRKLHNFEARGSWTKEQDEELAEAFEQFPKQWTKIGEAINRFPEDSRDRWRNYLVCGDNMKKSYWDKEEEFKLREVVAECIESVREMRQFSKDKNFDGKTDEELIDWGIVSTKMGLARSRLQCIGKWKQIKDREDSDVEDKPDSLGSTAFRLEEAARHVQEMKSPDILSLLRAIRDSGTASEKKIPWRIVSGSLNAEYKRMAWKMCFRKLRKRVPGEREMNFKGILQYLLEAFEAAAPSFPLRFVNKESIGEIVRRKRTKAISAKEVNSADESDTMQPHKQQSGNEKKSLKLLERTRIVDDGEGSSGARNEYSESQQNSNGEDPSKRKKSRNTQPSDEEPANEEPTQQSEIEEPQPKRRLKLKQKEIGSMIDGEIDKVDNAEIEEPLPKKRARKSKPKHADSGNEHDNEHSNGLVQAALEIEEPVDELEVEEPPPKKRTRKGKRKQVDSGEALGESSQLAPEIHEPVEKPEIEDPPQKKSPRKAKQVDSGNEGEIGAALEIKEIPKMGRRAKLKQVDVDPVIDEEYPSEFLPQTGAVLSKKTRQSKTQPKHVDANTDNEEIILPGLIRPAKEIEEPQPKKARKSTSKKASTSNVGELNEATQAVHKINEPPQRQKARNSKTNPMIADNAKPIPDSESSVPKKKKRLHDRMKQQGKIQSQDPLVQDTHPADMNIEEVVLSLKKARKSPQGTKKTALTAKQHLNEMRIDESDEEQQALLFDTYFPTPRFPDENEGVTINSDHDVGELYGAEGQEYGEDTEESQIHNILPPKKMQKLTDEEENTLAYYDDPFDYTPDVESGPEEPYQEVDEDTTTPAPRHSRPSPDLDTPIKDEVEDGRRKSSRCSTRTQKNYFEGAYINDEELGEHQGLVDSEAGEASVSSSDYSIPAEATPRHIRMKRAEDDEEDDEIRYHGAMEGSVEL